LASRAQAKLLDAHPMVRLAAMTKSSTKGNMTTILPTDVTLIPVLDVGAGPDKAVRVDFAYGPAGHAERATGWARIRPGVALSFMNLDGCLQVRNTECDAINVGGAIKVVNNDMGPVIVSIYRAAELLTNFESPLATKSLQASEEVLLNLPESHFGSIFQVEIQYETKDKAYCDMRPGQCVYIEGCPSPRA